VQKPSLDESTFSAIDSADTQHTKVMEARLHKQRLVEDKTHEIQLIVKKRQQEDKQVDHLTRKHIVQSLLETQTSFVKLWDDRIQAENKLANGSFPEANVLKVLPQSYVLKHGQRQKSMESNENECDVSDK